jgi:predicted metal-dependent hydrolase
MSHKDPKLAPLIQPFYGQTRDPHYLAFFGCFNRQLFFEAHEVLEILWLGKRGHPDGRFYQGLIQLAGAFVHLQKQRLPPAAALFRLARQNLALYPSSYQGVDLAALAQLMDDWLARTTVATSASNPLSNGAPYLPPPTQPS